MFIATITTIKVTVILVVDHVTLAISNQVVFASTVTFIDPTHSVEVDGITVAISNFVNDAAVSTIKVAHFDVVFRVAVAIADSLWIWATV